jgi:hypothetical protein
MTRKILNTGQSANDGKGDTLREASEKINANFLELYEITKLEEGMSLEFLSKYVTDSIDSAFDGVTLDEVVANTHAINLLDVRVGGHDTQIGGLVQEIQDINDLIDNSEIGGVGPQGPIGMQGPSWRPRWIWSDRTSRYSGSSRHNGFNRKPRRCWPAG